MARFRITRAQISVFAIGQLSLFVWNEEALVLYFCHLMSGESGLRLLLFFFFFFCTFTYVLSEVPGRIARMHQGRYVATILIARQSEEMRVYKQWFVERDPPPLIRSHIDQPVWGGGVRYFISVRFQSRIRP